MLKTKSRLGHKQTISDETVELEIGSQGKEI